MAEKKPTFSERLVPALQAGTEQGLYMTPILGELLSMKDSYEAGKLASEAEGFDKAKMYALSTLMGLGSLPIASEIMGYTGISPALKSFYKKSLKNFETKSKDRPRPTFEKGYKTDVKEALLKMDKELIDSMSDKELANYIKINFGIDQSAGNVTKIKKELFNNPKPAGTTTASNILDNAINDVDKELIGTMTNSQLVSYINKNYPNANATLQKIQNRARDGKINTIVKSKNAKEEIENALNAIENPQQYSVRELFNMPAIQEIVKNHNIKFSSFKKYKSNLGVFNKKKKSESTKFQTTRDADFNTRLDYVRNIEELYGGTIDNKALRIIKAHALGEGKVIDLDPKDIVALEKKIKYIPSEFLESIKKPSFFLTYSNNFKHRKIENNLINSLVDKYQKLGYKFIDNAEMPWVKPKKEIDLSLPQNKDLAIEIQNLNKKIDGFKKNLSDMDAFTLFYNPIKKKMVSYGQEISKIPGLASIVTKVKKDPNFNLKDGGLVGIDRMTRSLREF